MNIKSFTSEVVSAPSARRVSDRKKVLTLVDKSFFKKTYKPKNQKVSSDTSNKPENQDGISNCIVKTSFQNSVQFLFPALQGDCRQRKAIHNYRAKKLKKMFGTECALEDAIAKHKSLGLNILLLQYFKRVAPNGKALYANSRARDASGRFNGALLSKPHSSELSTVDLREDCATETLTTAEGSILSLLSLDSLENPGQHNFDFDTLFETSRRAPRSLSLVFQDSQISASSPTEPLPVSPRAIVTSAHHLSEGEKPYWEADGDLEDSLSYSYLPCNMFTVPLEEDLCFGEDL